MTTYIKKDFASPNGPILLLSAKGSTTASIAQANGVPDFSGNGNHMTARSSVAVTTDSEKGNVFDFTATSGNMGIVFIPNSRYSWGSRFATVCFFVKWTTYTGSGIKSLFGTMGASPRTGFCADINNNRFDLNVGTDHLYYNVPNDFETNKWYHLCYVIDDVQKIAKFFLNGVEVTSASMPSSDLTQTIVGLGFGAGVWLNSINDNGYFPTCYMTDIHVYPRALSAAEIKYLYNGFQPNLIMGQTIPSGAILDLSARGLTTAGIAQANGVVDRSGNGNHGQAYGGVAVVNDDEMGSCFSLVNVSGNSNLQYCQFDLTDTDVFSIRNEITITTTILFRKNQLNFICGCGTTGNVGLWLLVNISDANSSVVNFNAGNLGQQAFTLLDLVLDKFYVITVTLNSNKELSLFIDGTFISSKTLSGDISTCGNPIRVGNITTPGSTVGARLLDGEIESLRIYPRALTASEVHQLADASLKKIRDINMGSNLIKHIYYGGNLIYAKTDNYIYNDTPTEVSFKIHQLNSASQRNTIEYAGINSAYDSITYSNGTVNMGDWSDWINAHFTPVMLKSDGTVDYELNRDNLNYKSDGSTPSDIANVSYDGNAMLQIKKFYISITTSTEDAHEVFNVHISDTKKDNTYTCWGFVDKDGNEQDYAYYGLFHGYIDANNKLRSKAGVTLSSFTNQGSFSTMRTAAINNGSGWDISNYALENAIGLVLMMLYKDVNPMFVHQDSSNNYRETSTTPYATTGALAASGGFPWTTTSTMPKALWIESYWRNAAIPGLSCNIWINGLGTLKNSANQSGFGIYYKLKPPYDLTNPSLWTYMSNTVPYIYSSVSHQIQDVTVYENLLFPKSNGPNSAGSPSGLSSTYYNRFWGGGDINGGTSASYHNNTTEIKPAKNGLYRALDKWAAPPHYLCYQAFGSSTRTEHVNGSARLTYLKNSN